MSVAEFAEFFCGKGFIVQDRGRNGVEGNLSFIRGNTEIRFGAMPYGRTNRVIYIINFFRNGKSISQYSNITSPKSNPNKSSLARLFNRAVSDFHETIQSELQDLQSKIADIEQGAGEIQDTLSEIKKL